MGKVRWFGLAVIGLWFAVVCGFVFVIWQQAFGGAWRGLAFFSMTFLGVVFALLVFSFMSLDALSCLGPYWWKRRD